MFDDSILKKIQSILSPKEQFYSYGRKDPVLDALDDPVFLYEKGTIKYLFEHVISRDDLLSEKALDCIKTQVQRFNDKAWVALEEDFRTGYYRFSRDKWFSLRPIDVAGVSKHGDDELLITGLLTFHNNGYIREEALIRISRFETSKKTLMFILLRANDWVGRIRDLAEEYLLSRVRPENTREWISALAYLYRLANCRRKDHTDLIRRVEDLLLKSDPEMLKEALNSPDGIARREGYNLLWRTDTDLIELLELGLNNHDVTIQRMAVNKAMDVINSHGSDMLYKAFRNSKSATVRAAAADLLEKCNEYDLLTECKGLLLDSSPSVRASARYWLKKYGFSDFKGFYRTELGKEPQYAAICGLGEVGTQEDADALFLFTWDDQRLKFRKAAIKAIARLNPEDYIDLFIESLADKSRGVSSEARRALQANISWVDESKLWALLNESEQPLILAENILLVFTSMPKWKALIQLLRMLNGEYHELDLMIKTAIEKWTLTFNRSYIKPTEVELEEIRSLLQNSHKLAPEVKVRIEFLISAPQRFVQPKQKQTVKATVWSVLWSKWQKKK